MTYAISIDKSQLLKGYYSEEDNLSSKSSSFLSEDFCLKVLGKPCLHYKKPAKLDKQLDKKKVLFDIKKEVAVYTVTEKTKLKTSKDSVNISNTQIEVPTSKETIVLSKSQNKTETSDSKQSNSDEVISNQESIDGNETLNEASQSLSQNIQQKESSSIQATPESLMLRKGRSVASIVSLTSNKSEEFSPINHHKSEIELEKSQPRSKDRSLSKQSSPTLLHTYRPSYPSQKFELENKVPSVTKRQTSKIYQGSKLDREISRRKQPELEYTRLNSSSDKRRFFHNKSVQNRRCNACENCIFEEVEDDNLPDFQGSFRNREQFCRCKETETVAVQKDFLEEYHLRPCFCDENSQTSHPSILKRRLESSMDTQPVKDTPVPVKDKYTFTDKKFADKTLQTSNDSFYRNKYDTASNTSDADFISRGINTVNTDSFNVQVTEVNDSKAQTSNSSSTPIEICYQPVRYDRAHHHMRYSQVEECPPDIQYSRPMQSRPQDYQVAMGESYCVCQNVGKANVRCYPCRNYHREPQRHLMSHRANVVPCTGHCRNCITEDHPPSIQHPQYGPPTPPVYNFSDSDYEDDADVELVIDQGQESDGYSSDNSRGLYNDLPYQNHYEYGDLVQELEESIQIRNKNRVNRALLEFEQRSKQNKPLERPIIDYEEASESEEPLMRKISELTEKRKQLHKSFPCKGRACCNCIITNQKTGERIRLQPVKNLPPAQSIRKPHMKNPRWQLDNETGEWFKVYPKLSKKITNLPPPQKDDHLCGCTCTCGR